MALLNNIKKYDSIVDVQFQQNSIDQEKYFSQNITEFCETNNYEKPTLGSSDCSNLDTNNNELNIKKVILNKCQANSEAIQKLINRTGYPLIQENGQRKYGPPSNWNEIEEPDRGCEVFIGKIPRDCFEDELIPLLEKIGLIYEFRLMIEYSGFNRGYGFAMFTTREDAKKCVFELNNFEIRKGKMIGVCRSVDNCRLFVGGIPKTKKKEEILEEIKKLTEHVLDVIIYPSAHDKTKNRGFAFVQFTNHRSAALARKKLISNRVELFNQPIAVDWAEPELEVDEDVMATVKVLYVRNLMLSTTEDKIKREFELVSKEGSIERVKKMKDFAFIHFRERKDALNCIKIMNGKNIDGSNIEVSLSKPVDKHNFLKLGRNSSSPTNNLDLNILFGQNLVNSPIIPISSLSESTINSQIQADAICNANLNLYTRSSKISSDYVNMLNQNKNKRVSNQKMIHKQNKVTRGTTFFNRSIFPNYPKFSNSNSHNMTIGILKKQASIQDVQLDLFSQYSNIPILPYRQNTQIANKASSQILEELCKNEGYLNPIYTLHSTNGTDADGREINLYMYKVMIPDLHNGNQYCSNILQRSIEEAKEDASEFVINQLNLKSAELISSRKSKNQEIQSLLNKSETEFINFTQSTSNQKFSNISQNQLLVQPAGPIIPAHYHYYDTSGNFLSK